MTPFFREAGAGPGVVCLHANASTSGQWRGLEIKKSAQCHEYRNYIWDLIRAESRKGI